MITVGMKQCRDCKRELPLELEFCRVKANKDGRHNQCKKCMASYEKKRREEKPAHERRAFNRHWTLKKAYGITLEQFRAMWAAQAGRCAICTASMIDPDAFEVPVGMTKHGTPNVKGRPMSRFACVDHDHATGKVRGLLCGHCNRLLGMAGERAEVLAAAIRYLETHK